ncbi:MAG: hypothetical protein R3346_00200 [Candidatus Spechtbacterales bacterium]|nr:hypothetical protein [Candidatus Spechtbacterales bacterium]
MKSLISKTTKILKEIVKTITPLLDKMVSKLIAFSKRSKDWFLNLEIQHQALVSLALLFAIGLIGLLVTLSGPSNTSSNSADPAEVAKEPEREIFFTCTETEITPAEITISAKEFIRFRFKNEASNPTSFGLRAREDTFLGFGGGETSQINSTIAIAPQTIASFSWRIPAEIKGRTIESYCSRQDSEVTGIVKFNK